MLDVKIIAVGKVKNKNFGAAIVEYLKRIKPYARIELVEVKPEAFGSQNKEVAKKTEGERLLKSLASEAAGMVYLLQEQGKEFNSEKFARFLEKQNSRVVLVIAGALGFSDEIKNKYPNSISLSQMTIPHELARVVLLEQLYRAATIIQGKEYHY